MTQERRRTGDYVPTEVEEKWQERWDQSGIYTVRDDDPRPKWYELTMYPYPSGDLHIGHWYAMSGADAHARFRRMQGFNVLHPMGFDAFGLPAENAAIKDGVHPHVRTMENIENMRRQLRSMGTIYDWDRELVTCLPDYYKWKPVAVQPVLQGGAGLPRLRACQLVSSVQHRAGQRAGGRTDGARGATRMWCGGTSTSGCSA